MRQRTLSRRAALQLLGASVPVVRGAFAFGGARATEADDALHLQPTPTRLYATADPGRERSESFVFHVLVESARPRELSLEELQVELGSRGARVIASSIVGAALAPLVLRPGTTNRGMDGAVLASPLHRPLAVRIRCSAPAASAVDAIDVRLTMREGNAPMVASARFPVERYVQRTRLLFPFTGAGIITNAGVTNGGHGNRSGQFALDVVGLNAAYAVYAGAGTTASADYADWGRPIIAPAAGEVVFARADRPDQPDPEKSDPAFYASEYPQGGDPGNHVIIAHGDDEFSMIAHLQAGSLRVRAGERVAAGQLLGLLGSSGDTVTPHVHYQLQSGPDWRFADGLPCVFTNVSAGPLVRGTFLDAK